MMIIGLFWDIIPTMLFRSAHLNMKCNDFIVQYSLICLWICTSSLGPTPFEILYSANLSYRTTNETGVVN